MEIKGEYRIARDREAVWAALNDADVLRICIPGCESLERTGGNEFRGKIAAAIGPVRARFDTQLTLENLDPPERYTLSGESKAGAAGFGRGRADVCLLEQDGGTLLTYRAEFKVGGKLAQVGSRLVLGATRKTADGFFQRLSQELDAGAARPQPGAAPGPAGPSPSRAWIVAAAVLVVLLIGWILLR